MTKARLQEQNKTLLVALETVSETLARWSLNKGPLDYGRGYMSDDEQRELNDLELVLEKAIVGAGGQW